MEGKGPQPNNTKKLNISISDGQLRSQSMTEQDIRRFAQQLKLADERSKQIKQSKSSKEQSNPSAQYTKRLTEAKQKIVQIRQKNNQKTSSGKNQSVGQSSDSSNSNQSAVTDASAKIQQTSKPNQVSYLKNTPKLSTDTLTKQQKNKPNQIKKIETSSQKQNLQTSNKSNNNQTFTQKIKKQIFKIAAQKITVTETKIEQPNINTQQTQRAALLQNNTAANNLQTNTSPLPQQLPFNIQNSNATSNPINNIFQPNSISQSIFTHNGIQSQLYFPSIHNAAVSKVGITPFSSQNLKSLEWEHHRMKIMQILSNKPYENSYKQIIAIMTLKISQKNLNQFVQKHHSRLAELAQLVIATQVSRTDSRKQQLNQDNYSNSKAYNLNDLMNCLELVSNQLQNSQKKQQVEPDIQQQYQQIKHMTESQFRFMMNKHIEKSYNKLKDIACFQIDFQKETANERLYWSLKNTQQAQSNYAKTHQELISEINSINDKQNNLEHYLALLQKNLYKNYYISPKNDITYLIETCLQTQADLQKIQLSSDVNNSSKVAQMGKSLIKSMHSGLNEIYHQITSNSIPKKYKNIFEK